MPKQIVIPKGTIYDESKNEFYDIKEQKITIEHSLISISKWEEIWKRPFFSITENFTREEHLDYIRCMTLTPNVPYEAYYNLSNKTINEIIDYENEVRSGTTVHSNNPQRRVKESLSAEVIYYYMIKAGIPFDPCQKWHFSRLMKLLEVFGVKENPKKMSKRDVINQYAKLNEMRKKKFNTRG